MSEAIYQLKTKKKDFRNKQQKIKNSQNSFQSEMKYFLYTVDIVQAEVMEKNNMMYYTSNIK